MLTMIYRGLFLLLLAIALYGGLKPDPIPQVISNFDLVLHFGAFFLMSVFLKVGFSRSLQLPGVIFLLLMAVGIEVWQGLALPGRTASAIDMLANFLGILLGWSIGTLVLSIVGSSSLK